MLNLKNNNSSAKQIESNVEYNSPFIFTKKINTNYKLVPFNIVENDVGKTKYLPPVSKEWKNTVYNYSPQNNINYPIYDLNINSLIRGYFSLYFNNKFLQHKYISRRTKRKSLNRIFVSKAEIKHTNEKAIITLYVFNKERLSLLKRIQKIKKILGFGLKNRISFMTDKWMNFLSYVSKESKSSNLIDTPVPQRGWESINNSLSLLLKFNVNDRLRKINFLYYMRNKRFFKKVKKVFSTFRRLKLKLSLNKYKFEEKFLSKLSQSISKYYGKKVEFNIVNLKSIAYNTDIFTEILTIKLRKPKSSPMRRINSLLSKVALPKVNTIIERGRVEKQVDRELIDNKYRNININHILNKLSEQDINSKDNLNKLLYNIYYKTILDNSNDTMESVVPLKTKNSKDNISSFSSGDLNKAYYSNLRNIIFENIKYKAMGGARLIVKGRLTKRYRADRAVYKLKWKGGLKNIDSSFKGLSAVVFRGFQDSNVTKSFMANKRRIGSFGVKAWMSGKNYSTLARSSSRSLMSEQSNTTSIQPWAVTGFTDAEGCFLVILEKNPLINTGWGVRLRFQIHLHSKDKALLQQISNYFGAGKLYDEVEKNSVQLRVDSIKELEVVINHFDKYPLLTQKFKDYILFKQAFNLVKNKNHLSMEGLRHIVAIKASLNLGLSDNLKEAFPNITPACIDSELFNQERKIVDPNWLVGFASGEGCFWIKVYESQAKLGQSVQLVFQITQHIRDEALMNSLVSYIGCGYVKKHKSSYSTFLDFTVTKFLDNYENIIPFFNQYKILGIKRQDFEDWSKAAELIKNKAHLTTDGLKEILKIKSGINKGRIL